MRHVHHQPRSGARSVQGEDPEREPCTDAEADACVAFKAACVSYLAEGLVAATLDSSAFAAGLYVTLPVSLS